MSEITATEAARKFADLLDDVEHDVEHGGGRYTITRRGKAVAQVGPVARGRGADVKAILSRHHLDAGWTNDLAEVRGLLEVEQRP